VLNVVMPSVIMLSVVMLSVVMLSVIMLSVIMLSVIMLSVIMLSVAVAFLMYRKIWLKYIIHNHCHEINRKYINFYKFTSFSLLFLIEQQA
jgi:hypothetical protein